MVSKLGVLGGVLVLLYALYQRFVASYYTDDVGKASKKEVKLEGDIKVKDDQITKDKTDVQKALKKYEDS